MGEQNDAVVLGASSRKHFQQNLVGVDNGLLSEEVVQALDAGWQVVRGMELKFWH
jgi:aflatoxin B1 aldehyde reductase